jgi:two-component system LytT family response regulator
MPLKHQTDIEAKLIPLPIKKIEPEYLKKLAIPSQGKIEIIQVKDIFCLIANGNYTSIHLNGDKVLTACITLKRFQEKLDPKIFIRVHQGSLVNMNCITKYLQCSNTMILTNSMQIKVSRSNKSIITKFLKQITP